MYYSERTFKRLIITREVIDIMRASRASDDSDLKPLSFSEACEVMKIDMLEQMKENIEDIAFQHSSD